MWMKEKEMCEIFKCSYVTTKDIPSFAMFGWRNEMFHFLHSKRLFICDRSSTEMRRISVEIVPRPNTNNQTCAGTSQFTIKQLKEKPVINIVERIVSEWEKRNETREKGEIDSERNINLKQWLSVLRASAIISNLAQNRKYKKMRFETWKQKVSFRITISHDFPLHFLGILSVH